MAEPDVIERMAKSAWRATNPPGWENTDNGQMDWRINGPSFVKMLLAAVRELEEALRFSGRIYAASSVQEMRIEHERRAGGKGE